VGWHKAAALRGCIENPDLLSPHPALRDGPTFAARLGGLKCPAPCANSTKPSTTVLPYQITSLCLLPRASCLQLPMEPRFSNVARGYSLTPRLFAVAQAAAAGRHTALVAVGARFSEKKCRILLSRRHHLISAG
jgi:hypothetical protein